MTKTYTVEVERSYVQYDEAMVTVVVSDNATEDEIRQTAIDLVNDNDTNEYWDNVDCQDFEYSAKRIGQADELEPESEVQE